MSAFEQASKHLLFKIMRAVTEQQAENPAFRFVYYRTLTEIRDKLVQEGGEMRHATAFATMFGSLDSPKSSLQLFCGAVDQVIETGSTDIRIVIQDRDYLELPEVINIIWN